jgi:hypothetical protein
MSCFGYSDIETFFLFHPDGTPLPCNVNKLVNQRCDMGRKFRNLFQALCLKETRSLKPSRKIQKSAATPSKFAFRYTVPTSVLCKFLSIQYNYVVGTSPLYEISIMRVNGALVAFVPLFFC